MGRVIVIGDVGGFADQLSAALVAAGRGAGTCACPTTSP